MDGLKREVSEVKKAFEEELKDDGAECDSSGDNDHLCVHNDEVVMTIDQKQARRIRKMIKEKRAKFNHATMDIIRSIICCKYCMPNNFLRKYRTTRTVMNYKLGIQRIDKEMDIGNIIQKIRTLNYFMKMILDVD